MSTRIDMHSHSRHSDGVGSPQAIAQAAKEAGLDGLVVSDHHSNMGPEIEAVRAALLEVGVLPIIACEYSTDQGHLQVFGVRVPVGAFGMYPQMQDVIDEVNRLGGACVVPHPFKRGYSRQLCADVYKLKGLAALEVINGQLEVDKASVNREGLAAAARMGLPMTGASDAHRPSYVGVAFTDFAATITDDAGFIAALKSGDFRPGVNEEILGRLRGAGARSWTSPTGRQPTFPALAQLPPRKQPSIFRRAKPPVPMTEVSFDAWLRDQKDFTV